MTRTAPEVAAVERSIVRLVEQGWEVFPLAPRSKEPLQKGNWRIGDHRFFDWQRHLAADGNYAVRPTAGQVIIDTDPRDGKRGDLELFGLELTLGELPPGPTVETGRRDGGRHRYFTKPINVPTRRNIASGVEAISIGGYVVGVGSIHPDTGLAYRWLPGSIPPPPLPAAWLDFIRKPPRPPRTGQGGEITCQELERLLAVLDPAAFAHNDTFHGIAWLDLAMACHDATDGDGFAEFQEWCARDDQYGSDFEALNQARWESFDAGEPGGYTIRTLYRAVIATGHRDLVAKLGHTFVADFPDDDLEIDPAEPDSEFSAGEQ